MRGPPRISPLSPSPPLSRSALIPAVRLFDPPPRQPPPRPPAYPQNRVNVGAGHRRGNTSRKIAIRNQANPRTRAPYVVDQFLVPRTIQNDHGQVFDVATKTPRYVTQIFFYGRVNVDHAARRRSAERRVGKEC